VATRCQIVGGLRSHIVSSINELLHNDNQYVQIKLAKEMFEQQDVPTNINPLLFQFNINAYDRYYRKATKVALLLMRV